MRFAARGAPPTRLHPAKLLHEGSSLWDYTHLTVKTRSDRVSVFFQASHSPAQQVAGNLDKQLLLRLGS